MDRRLEEAWRIYAYDYRNSNALAESIGTYDACVGDGSTSPYSSRPSSDAGA